MDGERMRCGVSQFFWTNDRCDKGLGLGVQYKMLGLRMVLEIILVEMVIECHEMFSPLFSHQNRKTEYCLALRA